MGSVRTHYWSGGTWSAAALPVLAVLTLSSPAQAQWAASQPSISVAATIPVVRQFNTTNSEDLRFGTIAPGDSIVISPTATGTTASDRNAAKLNIRFNAGTAVTVTAPLALTHGNGSSALPVDSYTCSVANDNAGTGATPFTCAIGHQWTGSQATAMASRWILVGGKVSASSAALNGTYSGSITIALAASDT